MSLKGVDHFVEFSKNSHHTLIYDLILNCFSFHPFDEFITLFLIIFQILYRDFLLIVFCRRFNNVKALADSESQKNSQNCQKEQLNSIKSK